MKNKEYRIILAIVTAISLTTTSFFCSSTNVYAQNNIEKTETVYAQIGEDGKVSSTIVSDQLKNISGKEPIEDISSLQNIENVKGDETFSQKNQVLTWNGDEKDICYQGTTQESLPVGMKYSYTLNGKSITPEELAGKSGHLIIHCQYENTSADQGDYVPFVMMTGILLDNEKFTNVQLDNGRLISDGERDIAVAVGIPQLKETLGVSDLNIPDSFELEADVTDYESLESVTIATNDIFNDLNTDKLNSLTDLETALNQLSNSSTQLVNGSGQLKKGLDTLLDSSGTLTGGIDQLFTGSMSLKNGANQLALGTNTLHRGLSSAAENTSGKLLPGITALDDGVTQMQSQLSYGLTALQTGVQSLDAGLNTPQSGSSTSLKDAAATVSSGLATAAESSTNLTDAARTLSEALNGTTAPYTSNGSTTGTSTSPYTVASGTGESEYAINNLYSLLERSDIPEDAKTTIQNSINALTNDQTARNNAATALDNELQAQSTTLSTANADIKTLAETVYNGTANLSGSLTTLSTAATGVSSGVEQAAAGAAQLNTNISGQGGLIDQVNQGVSGLKTGTKSLRGGIEGTDTTLGLADALNQLAIGSSTLTDGADTLDSGALSLANGITTLQKGSGTLISGVQQLDDGADTLNKGLIQFDQEGIQKLVDAFDGNVDGLLDKINTILDSSRNYRNFSGISDNMDGNVKFILISDK